MSDQFASDLPDPRKIISVDVRRMGSFVGVDIKGATSHAMFPLHPVQARKMIADLEAALAEISGEKRQGRKR